MFEEFDSLDTFSFDFFFNSESSSSSESIIGSPSASELPEVKVSSPSLESTMMSKTAAESCPLYNSSTASVSNYGDLTSYASYDTPPESSSNFILNSEIFQGTSTCTSSQTSSSSSTASLPKSPILAATSTSNNSNMVNLEKVTINPRKMGFIPKNHWEDGKSITLSTAINTHFKSRSTKIIRFEHKLWNALQLTSVYPELYATFGVIWVDHEKIIKADREKLGPILGITKPNAALFSQQGAFPSHGFVEITKKEAIQRYGADSEKLTDVDENSVRLFVNRGSCATLDEFLVSCKWNSPGSI